MPTKRNKAGYQQPYVEKGHGDDSGEYRDNGYGGNSSGESGNEEITETQQEDTTKTTPQDKAKEYGIEKPNFDKSSNDFQNDVQNIKTDYPSVLNKYRNRPDGTYDLATGKTVEYENGYQVSFQQTSDKYTQEEYNKIIDDLMNRTGSSPHIGVFDKSPEVSFHVKDLKTAIKIGKMFNQHSIFDWKAKAEGKLERDWFIEIKGLDKSKNNVNFKI